MSAPSKPQQWGVTAPISIAAPTQHELQLTETLVEALKSYNLFESDQEARKREIVLGKLNTLTKDFVYRVSKLKGFPESLAKEAGGKIFTFGSYRLGVHNAGSDIDCLAVLPRHVEREQFFTIMYDMLKEQNEVTEITAVSDAYVPVITMHFSGIPIDFVCARLSLARIADDLELSDNNLLKNLDERCIRSLNGSRVTDDILRLVPNIPAFRIALRCVKLWAKKRAIYSNVMGFLGGVAWAMLVARICQLYPNACAGAIVSRFFRIMYQWNWPQPVLLKHMEDGPLPVRVWNPKLYPADKSHRMPIITPAYPSMCATHNVTDSTRTIMISEFKRAAECVDKIFIGAGQWAELFENHSFFQTYKYYLQVIASSDSAESQLKWSGMVESRLRQLVLKLELVDMLVLAHPYVKPLDRVHYCSTDQEALDAAYGVFNQATTFALTEGNMEVNHMELLKENNENSDAQEPQEPPRKVYTTTFFIGLFIEPKTAGTTGTRKLNISWPCAEFTKLVKSWDKYDEATMGITIKYIKSSMLPADVVEGDPKKLKRPQGKSKTGNPPAVNNEKPNKKMRSGTEEQVDNATATHAMPAGNNEENMPAGPPTAEPLSS
ncbi:polynucleotide adenylyltransferase [Umbelopsis sp. WA50703]